MLDAIRKQAGSWVVKILLLLLVASFAVWGIGDVFYSGQQDPVVATVGESEIHASEAAQAFERRMNSMQQRLGVQFDRQQAIGLGLMQQALQDLIAGRLIDLHARELGLTVDDETLRRLVTSNTVFHTAGRFDRSRFEQLLYANGMDEASYLAALRQEMVRDMLTGSVAAPIDVPDVLVETLYEHRNEQREGRALVIDPAAIDDVPEPDQAELEAYHAEHEERFTAPEYRAISYVALEPADMLDEVQIADEEVASVYEMRQAQYRTAERRTVEQLLASEREVIEQAADQVAEGASFAEVADALAGEGLARSELGEVTPGQLPEELSDPIFALGEGELSEPVESPFGWHLFRVTELLEEEVRPLEEVEDELRQELALEEARARLPSLANALDDELAAGVGLEEAAESLALEVQTIEAVDARGRGPEGETPEALPPWPSFLEVAFASPAGESSLLEETEDGSYFVLRVDEVMSPRLRPLDEVRDQVSAAWRAEKRQELARERAEALLEETRGGATLEAAAEPAGAEVTAFGPIRRDAQGDRHGLGPAAVRALFATPPGSVADSVVEVGDRFAIVATDDVIPADPANDPEGMEQLAERLRAEMRDDLAAQFNNALREFYPVEVDQSELARLMEGGGRFGSAAPMPPPGGGFGF